MIIGSKRVKLCYKDLKNQLFGSCESAQEHFSWKINQKWASNFEELFFLQSQISRYENIMSCCWRFLLSSTHAEKKTIQNRLESNCQSSRPPAFLLCVSLNQITFSMWNWSGATTRAELRRGANSCSRKTLNPEESFRHTHTHRHAHTHKKTRKERNHKRFRVHVQKTIPIQYIYIYINQLFRLSEVEFLACFHFSSIYLSELIFIVELTLGPSSLRYFSIYLPGLAVCLHGCVAKQLSSHHGRLTNWHRPIWCSLAEKEKKRKMHAQRTLGLIFNFKRL